MAEPPSWYSGFEYQEVQIDASDPDRIRRLSRLTDFATRISQTQHAGVRGELRFSPQEWMDGYVFDLMSITEISTPDGTIKVSIDPELPPQISPAPKDATWYRAAPHVGIEQPIIVKTRFKGDWSNLPIIERDEANRVFTRYLKEILRVPVYNRITNAVSRTREIISALDRVPDSDEWNALLELGYGHRSAHGKTPDRISDTYVGKANKRLRMLTEGGDHFFTPFPDHIEWADNIIPVGGEFGMVELSYDVIDNWVNTEVDINGNIQTNRMNTTDGGGDIRRSAANRIYRALHGAPLPEEIGGIQINLTGRPYTTPDGEDIGGVWKMLATIVDDADYDAMLLRDGMDTGLQMRISTDSLAGQHDNPDAASGRIIWHKAKPTMFKDVAVGGLLSLPNAARYYDMEQFYERHFEHVVDELYDEITDFERRIPDLADALEEEIPDYSVESERLDPATESSEEAEWVSQKRRINQERVAEQFEALTTGSPYASSGLMDLAQRTTLKLDGMKRQSKGANAILIPMWKGKRTDAADLPANVEPARGSVRLRSIRSGRGYINWIVFNRDDMVDALMQKKFDGPDNDDEFGAKLSRDPRYPGRLFAHVTRDPQSIGGGAFLEVDPRDIPLLMRNDPYIFESFADAALNGELHPNLANIPGMTPEPFPRQYVDEIKSLLATGRTPDYNRAWELYDSLVSGMGNTQMVTNFDALAYNSGWIDSPEAVELWYTNLSDIVDAENGGFGTGKNIMEAKAQLAVEHIEAGRLVDRQLIEARPGYRAFMLDYVRQRAMMREERPKDAVRKFLQQMNDQLGSTPERQRQRQVVEGTMAMSQAVENLSNTMANGPHQWLTARVQRTPPPRWPFYILPEVDAWGRTLSDDWHNIYREAREHITASWKQNELIASRGNPDTEDMMRARKEIEDLWTKRAWNRIDESVREVESKVLEVSGYRRGMLFASLKQHESIKRASRGRASTHGENILLDQMGSRINKEFSHEEKMGYFRTGRRKIHPTLVLEYEGTPWNHIDRRTGRVRDSRQAGQRPSRVRYQRHEGRIGPFTVLKNPHARDFMELVSALGGELVYQGDVRGRKGYGVWQVEWRNRIYDPVTDKYLPKTREKIKRWLYDRFVVNAPVDAIPDMFTELSDLENLVYQTNTVTGRQVVATSQYLQYQAFAFPENQARTEFPNEPFTVEIPDAIKPRVPVERERAPVLAPVDPQMSMDGDPPLEGIELPLDLDLPPDIPDPLPDRPGDDEQLHRIIDDLDEILRQSKQEELVSVLRQRQQGNEKYVPPQPDVDPPKKSDVPVGRLGGRDDSFVLLRNMVREMATTITLFTPQEIRAAARARHRRAGITDFTDPDTGAPLFYLDEVWHSPNLGNYTSVRDVTRAWQDYANWRAGKNFWYSPAGIQHARNSDEAAACILKELYMRAEHRLIEREEKGFWYRLGDNVYHSGDKTHEVGQRVTGKMAMRALSFASGTYGIYPEVRFWTNRRFGAEKAVLDYMKELEIPVLFDGDPVAIARANRNEFDAEVARVSSLVADDAAKLALLNIIAKDMRGVNLFGQDFSPGVIQSVSELQDILKDGAEATKAIFRHMDRALDNNIEIASKIWARNGLENVLEGIGYRQLDPSRPLLYGDLSPEPDLPDKLKKTHLRRDLNVWKEVCQTIKDRMNQGDFFGAGLAGMELLNTRAVQFIRRHNAVYTYWSPHDLRSPGSLMPIARGTGIAEPLYGLVNVDSGVQDRAWNNSWMQLKEGFKRTIDQAVQRVLGDNYYKARRELMNVEDEFRKKTGVRLSMSRQLWAGNPLYNPRARVGASVLLVHRIRWYRALSEGFGAKILSKQLDDHEVPVRKRWILDKSPSCNVCIRNARQGWMMNHESFQSGHQQPPGHPGCDCRLRLSIDDRSKMGQVLKPLTQPRFLNVNRSQRRRLNMNPMRGRIPRVMRDVRIPAPPAVIPSLEI